MFEHHYTQIPSEVKYKNQMCIRDRSGTVCFFTVQAALLRAILVTVLFFGGVCCAVIFGGGAQKKLNALMHEQMGDFFRSEWEKTFGPDTVSYTHLGHPHQACTACRAAA